MKYLEGAKGQRRQARSPVGEISPWFRDYCLLPGSWQLRSGSRGGRGKPGVGRGAEAGLLRAPCGPSARAWRGWRSRCEGTRAGSSRWPPALAEEWTHDLKQRLGGYCHSPRKRNAQGARAGGKSGRADIEGRGGGAHRGSTHKSCPDRLVIMPKGLKGAPFFRF